MKKLFVALMAVLAVTTVSAQDNGQQNERKRGPEGRVEMMAKELNLTEAQKTQITALMDESKKQIEVLEQQKREILDAQKAKMEQILTPEQLAKFKEMKPRHRGHRGEFRGEGGPRPDFKAGKGEFSGRGPKGHGPRHHGKRGEGCENCPQTQQGDEAQK